MSNYSNNFTEIVDTLLSLKNSQDANFTDIGDSVLNKSVPGGTPDSLNLDTTPMESETALDSLLGNTTNVNNFFAAYSSGSPVPSNIDTFIIAAYKAAGQTVTTSQVPSTSLYQTFLSEYENIIGYNTDFSMIDTSSLSSSLPSIEDQFNNAFAAFVNSFTYPTTTSGSTTTPSKLTADTFFSEYQSFLTVTALVNNSSVPSNVTLATYEAAYNAFTPPANLLNGENFPTFTQFLTSFYQQQLISTSTNGSTATTLTSNPPNGYFIPSQAFGTFYQDIQQQYSQFTTGAAGPINTSVTTSSTAGVRVIARIIYLLITLINSLEVVAAAQADRLNILSEWQTAYSDALNQIHFFSVGSDSLGSQGSASNFRNLLNNTNQTYTQQLQGTQSVISDNAKSLQSNVQSSNDAANQASTLLSSIFSELTTIVSTLFSSSS